MCRQHPHKLLQNALSLRLGWTRHDTAALRQYSYAIGLAVAGDACAVSLCLDRPISFARCEFGLLYSDGYGGIDDDVQQELARRSGCMFETSLRPRERIWVELERGTLDMAGSGLQTPARNKFAYFAHYAVEDNHVLIGPQLPAGIKSMDDFKNWDPDPATPSGLVVSKKTITPAQGDGWQRLIEQMLQDGTM